MSGARHTSSRVTKAISTVPVPACQEVKGTKGRWRATGAGKAGQTHGVLLHKVCCMRMCMCARAPPASMPSARAYTHTLSCACVCRLKIACMYVYVAPAWTMAYCHGRLPLLMAACLLSAGTTPTPQRSGRGRQTHGTCTYTSQATGRSLSVREAGVLLAQVLLVLCRPSLLLCFYDRMCSLAIECVCLL